MTMVAKIFILNSLKIATIGTTTRQEGTEIALNNEVRQKGSSRRIVILAAFSVLLALECIKSCGKNVHCCWPC